jgi:hypothetical protein
MLTGHEKQGPRAKIMLYPYYATLIATSSGMSSSPYDSDALQRLTLHSHHVHDVPHGFRPQDLVLDP